MGGEGRIARGCDAEDGDSVGVLGVPTASCGAVGFKINFGWQGSRGVVWEGEEDAGLGRRDTGVALSTPDSFEG